MKNIIKTFKFTWELIPILSFLLFWEIAARVSLAQGNSFFPPFSQVLRELLHLFREGTLGFHLLKSLARVLMGFTGGSAAGLLLGIMVGWNKLLSRALHPILSLFYAIPILGWLPILLLWLGIGELLPILLIFISSFFPVLYNTATGIKSVEQDYIDAAKISGASNQDLLTAVVIPLALPNIFTGLKLGSGIAWRVIIAAEMIAIPTGIGALMIRSENLLRMDIMLVCLIVLAVMCLFFELILNLLEKRITGSWR